MTNDDGDKKDFRIASLTYLQSGILFLLISTVLIVYVGYQIRIGRVFTKSGAIPLGPGMPWAWLALESVAAAVGLVRGINMIRR
jgi:hypothetical protein